MNEYREACRRQHRTIANYLAVEAWSRGLDCVVLDREDMEALLGLKRFKSERLRWMQEDFEPWFPYQHRYVKFHARSFGSLYLSRVPIEEHLPEGTMSDEKRIRKMAPGSPQTERLSKGRAKIPDEAEMVSRLAKFAAGLDVPKPARRG